MNVVAWFFIILGIIGAFACISLIAGGMNTSPVDDSGITTSEETNLSATNVTRMVDTGKSVIPWMVIFGVVIILFGVFMWAIWAWKSGSGGYRSRYG